MYFRNIWKSVPNEQVYHNIRDVGGKGGERCFSTLSFISAANLNEWWLFFQNFKSEELNPVLFFFFPLQFHGIQSCKHI